ncbi:hypothetical protein GCM10022252_00610 [Streptosporangium oxazolinicum]|uniref:Uncharacterized protein n=1 Tax=Streptosporangium oxazolinicum TaxID=909287 RepID=A0ABP8A7I1_9ACTN
MTAGTGGAGRGEFTFDIDIEAEPAKLDGGWRSPRPTRVTESGLAPKPRAKV